MDYVNQLIAQAFEHVDKSTYKGKLGVRFAEMLEREKEKKKDNPELELDEEFVRKVKFLSECEKSNDLAWVEYQSWRTLSFEFRALFEKLVDPLFSSSGIYFQYSKFNENNNAIISKSSNDVVILVMTDGACFQFACMGANSNVYNWMSVSDFKKTSADYRKRIILSMANSTDGVVIKVIKREPKEESDDG